MKEIEINGGSCRYLSELDEFKNEIPFGIVNKTKTDVGGSYVAMNCDYNYIVVCPYKDLVNSLYLDKNNKYPVFKCYGGTTINDFKKYTSKVKKIAVTFDSLPKLMRWINPDDYKIVVDEYHTILSEIGFREDAIKTLIDNVKQFKHYSFLSATPISSDYEIDFFKNLPHYKVVWNQNYKQINLRTYPTSSVNKAIATVINYFRTDGLYAPNVDGVNTKVEQLFIFINSVTDINQIVNSLELDKDEVKICCAERLRNKQILGDYEVEPVSNPNKKINFFTKKGFQGCNLFTNNGLIIVASNGRKQHTLVDISTDLEQISGRIRFNNEFQNCFRNTIIHFFSKAYNVPSDEEFEQIMQEKENDAQLLLSGSTKLNLEERIAMFSKRDFEEDIVSYYGNGEIKYNPNKKAYFKFKRKISKTYKDNLSYYDEASKSSKFNAVSEKFWDEFNVKMVKATTFSYEKMLKEYLDCPSEQYEFEFPEFKLFRRYLKETEMNSLRWNKDKMIKAAEDRQTLETIFSNIYKEGFISSKDLKNIFKEQIDKYHLDITPKASLIESCNLYEVTYTTKKINGKAVKGYNFGKRKLCFSF